jgi:iron complex outermembrane recepter protein
VARPTGRLRQANLGFTEPGSWGMAVDLGDRVGSDGSVGWRVHGSADRLDPPTRNSQGYRWLAATALDWRLTPGRLIEAEVEVSRQSQPSTPGFSLLGPSLPPAAGMDPRINLNNQPWSLPVVFDGTTGSLRYSHTTGEDSQLVAHVMRQRLVTDDRIAFPFGCSAENPNFVPPFTYCSDKSFDLYDYRSENEHRTSDAAQLAWRGQGQWLGLTHQFNLGLLATRYQARFQRQAYNWAGTGTIDGLGRGTADAAQTGENTQRTERSSEWQLQDMVTLHPQWRLWAGLRHTRLTRDSVRTDGTGSTHYGQSFSTPWLALAWQPSAQAMAYASAGQGVESDVVPNRPGQYRNAGQALPAMKSRQLELGYKHRSDAWDASLIGFDITRPASNDLNGARVIDGEARHTGLEAEAEWRAGHISLRASATVLRARRQGSADHTLNGLRPTNVPERSLKLQAAYNLPQVPGLALLGYASHEGRRMVLPDNSVATPGWTRIDLAARYRQTWQGHTLVWRVGVDNLADRRAWKEAPYQYDHAYLYPLAPRTMHASVQVSY